MHICVTIKLVFLLTNQIAFNIYFQVDERQLMLLEQHSFQKVKQFTTLSNLLTQLYLVIDESRIDEKHNSAGKLKVYTDNNNHVKKIQISTGQSP